MPILTQCASTKTEYDHLNGWIKKMVTDAKISPKMVKRRDIAGNAEEEGNVGLNP